MTTDAARNGTPASAAKDTSVVKERQRRPVGGTQLGRDASAFAKKLAAAILEVLAGVRTTTDAASAVGLSLPRYYQVESKALAGLLRACEPCPKGRQRSGERELVGLRRQHEHLKRELARQQTLVRLAQRSVGLAPATTTAPAKANGKKSRRRRPVARALQVAERLKASAPAAEPDGQPVDADSLQKSP